MDRGTCNGNHALCSWCTGLEPKTGALLPADAKGIRRVVGCNDPVARGARSLRKGKQRQRTARKALGIERVNAFTTDNEESWVSPFHDEVKAGAQIRAAATAWQRIEQQVMANTDGSKPVRAVLMPDGWRDDGLVMVRLSTWRDVIAPALKDHTQKEIPDE